MRFPSQTILFLFVAFAGSCNAQPSSKNKSGLTTIPFRLGDSKVLIQTQEYKGNNDIVYISLHDDEQTSVTATKTLLKKEGGLLIRIVNNGERLVRFRLDGKQYAFDPNRIFSRDGISNTLIASGAVSNKAIETVSGFAERILSLIPGHVSCIVALHNNTEGRFSVQSFLPETGRADDAQKVHVNDLHDPDDFFITTDSLLYEGLSLLNYNTILQNNATVLRDGSLSVYCGERGLRYLNCETEHGRLKVFEEMIKAAHQQIMLLQHRN